MNVYIGPYPQNFNDLQELAHKGINTIFNLQTDNDFKQRRIDHHGQLEQCKVLKIDMIRCPIKNYDESDLRDKLCKAAEMLKNILETGKNVYVNCTSGMGRSVSVVVMYLVLFKSYTVDDAVAFVKKYRRVACPNVEAIKEVVNRMKPDTQFGYNDYAACLTIDISKYGY
jgi:protein-tyrosine phosphatase